MAYINASKNAGLNPNRRTKRKTAEYVNASQSKEKNTGGLLSGAGYVLGRTGLGLAGVVEGIADIGAAAGDLVTGNPEMAKYRFLDNQTAQAAETLENWYNPNKVMQIAGDVTSGIGNSLTFMIPYAGPWLAAAGYTGMGISSAAEKTGDVGLKEIGYGAVTGGMEFALDKLVGGAGQAAKNIGATVTRKLGREAAESGAKATAKLAGKSFGKAVLTESLKGAGGEALEEALSEAVDPALLRLFNIDPNAEFSLRDVAYAGMIGALSGGLMTAGPAAINYKNSAKVGQEIRKSGATQDFLAHTRRVLSAAQRTVNKNNAAATEAEAQKKAYKTAKKESDNEAKKPEKSAAKSKKAANRVADMADKVRKNLNTYEGYLQKTDKTEKELEISDAVLGELRGNVFLLENASLMEVYEEAVLELSDEDKQELVNEINEKAKVSGNKKADYTVDDLNKNTDDILTGQAMVMITAEEYGVDLFQKWRRTKAEPEKTTQTAKDSAQGEKKGKGDQPTDEDQKPVQGRYKGKGEVRIEGGRKVKELGLSDEQYRAYKAAEILAPALGVDIEISEAMADAEGRQINGFYNQATNSIKININAQRGADGKKIALYTLGHELTHYIKAWSPEKYQTLQDFVANQMGKGFDTAVEEKQEFLQRIGQDPSIAREEVVADSMELILTDGKVLEDLAKTDRSLWQKVKAWIQNTIAKIRKAYAGLNQASKTAQSLRETLETLDEVERLFSEAVLDTRKRSRTEEQIDSSEEDRDIRYSVEDENTTEDSAVETVETAYDTNVSSTEEETTDVKSEIKRLEKENQKQSEEIRKLQFERFRRAVKDGQIEANTKRMALSKGADAVLDSIGVTDGRNRRELVRRMTELYASMSAEKGITYEQAFDEAVEISNWLISRQPDVINAEMAEEADKILKDVTRAKVKLTAPQVFEAATNYGSYSEYRKAMFGRVTVSQDKEGTPLDVQWSEWSEQYPDIFDPDTKEADMPVRLAEIYKNLTSMRDNVEPIETYIDPDELAATIFTKVGEIGYKADADVFNDHTILADILLEVVETEQEYRIVKQYKEKAGELAEAERQQADLKRRLSAINREINDLQARINNVKKTKRHPWVMDELQDALKRKSELLDELNAITEKIRKEVSRLLSIRNAAPLRRAVSEANKRANAAERKAERAEKQERNIKEWAKETVRDIRAETDEKVKKAREEAAEYKSAVYAKAYEKADKRVEKYEENREEKKKQSEERREITIRKRSAQRILGQLNTLLYHPTRQKHVPEALRDLVEVTIRSQDPKAFEKNRKNIREIAELAGKIDRLESKVAKTALEQERLDKWKSRYEYLESETLSTKRQAEALLTAFEAYQKANRDEVTFDKALMDKMDDYVKQIEEAPLHEMTLKSITAVEQLYTMLKHQVDYSNKTFATERALDVDDLGRTASDETKATKPLNFLSPKGNEWAAMDGIRNFFWKNMKPLTVFEAIGSKTFQGLFENVLNGEEVWAQDILEARQMLVEAREKHGYKEWDLDKREEIKTKSGTVALSLSERMSLYAYSFREQAKGHLEGGGFVLDPKATRKGKILSAVEIEKRLNDQNRYEMDVFAMGKLAESLTEEQKAYVKEMQDYLTKMGEKGNEVSMKLYGMKLFTEEHYFPIKVKSEYLASHTGKSGDPNIKNRGMTKEIVPNAKDPMVLQGFDEIMVDHINSMATYHAFVLPVEDLMRVLNYKPVNYLRDENGNVILNEDGTPKVDDKAEHDFSTYKAVIESKYGANAVKYVEQLIRDLNGGARRDAAAGLIDRGITAFKRASTMASLSVLVQQPTSIIRAAAYIEPKYLFGNASIVDFRNHKALWEKVKKYAPVAVIKEMGGYDTGVGARTGDYLNATEYDKGERLKGFLTDANYRSEVFGKGAAYADEMAWIQLFEACVSEQSDKLGESRDSEKVLKAAGERFTEVVRHTQVYDSTLTRSEYMRSKDTGAKMATAFMAEPTTVVSMVAEAIMRGERGDTKFLRNTAGAVVGAMLLNAMFASLVYAMRDDDEDKNYGEKYLSTLAMETAEGINPAEYFPIFRDIMSLTKGYEVERSDMALIGDLINSIRRITSSKQSVSQKMANAGGAVASFFGLPLTNIMRDVNGLRFTLLGQIDTERFTGAGLSVAMKEEFDIMWGLWDDETTNGYQLYQATIKGDTKHFERVAARYESRKEVEMDLRQALRDYDDRITTAALARIDGELDVYEEIVKKIEAERHFDRSMIVRAVNNQISWIQSKQNKTVPEAEEDESEEEKRESLYNNSDLTYAMERGDKADFTDIYEYLMTYKQEDGKTESQARSSIKSSITSYWKKRYIQAWKENDNEEIKRIQAMLTDTGLYGSRNDVAKMGQEWVKSNVDSIIKK